MALNRFMKAAMKSAGSAGVSQAQVGQALQRMMGKGSLVKSAPNPANPARTRNFATDAATGRHRSISKKTADRYASYGKTKAKANAARTGTAAAAVTAAMAAKGRNPEAEAEEERNPAEQKQGPSKRGRPTRKTKKPESKGPKTRGGNRGPKSDSKSFNDAFKRARAAYKSGRTNATSFKWRGKSYSIVTKEDIKKAGSKDLRDYLNKGGKPKR